jgi:hypothetical protein
VTPPFKIFKKLVNIAKVLDVFEGDNEDIDTVADVLDDMSDILAVILSCNTTGDVYYIDDVEELFGLDDIISFLTEYLDWVNGIANSKNFNARTIHTGKRRKATGRA